MGTSYNLFIHKREQGTLWSEKCLNYVNGRILSISSSPGDEEECHASRFILASMDRFSTWFVAGDNLGNIYEFDFEKNKFRLVCKLGNCITALTISPLYQKDILVAASNYIVYCYNSTSRSEWAQLKGHESAITHISIHSSGLRAITSSLEQAIVWNLEDFSVLNRLTLACQVDIVKAFYQPLVNNIATTFVDGSIFLWTEDSLKCIFQKTLGHMIRTVDISRDGQVMATGTRQGLIEAFELDPPGSPLDLKFTISGNSPSIRHLSFLPNDKSFNNYNMVAVLTFDGVLLVYDLYTQSLLLQLASPDSGGKYIRMAIPKVGPHIILIGSLGNMDLFDLSILIPSLISDVSGKPKKKKTKRITVKISLPDEKFIPYEVNVNRLKEVVRTYGEFPSKYRLFIWRQLLHLPNNLSVFESMASQIRHLPLDLNLQDRYPIADSATRKTFNRILSLLVLWCPLMEKLNYLPALVFPFVKLFHRHIVPLFELLLTLICSWCQNWFVFHPLPPLNLLSLIENLLGYHDQPLLSHYTNCNVSHQIYAWPLMKSLLSEVFSREQWTCLWDHLFSSDPAFLVFIIVAFSIVSRNNLLRFSLLEEFQEYFQHQNNVPIKAVLKKAYELQDKTPSYLDPRPIVGSLQPLPKDTYPPFSNYPKIGIDVNEERKRIYQEELDYLQRRHTTLSMEDAALHHYTQSTPSPMLADADSASKLKDNIRIQSDRRKRFHSELEDLGSMKRSLLSHSHQRSKNPHVSWPPNYGSLMVKNTELLLQKKLLEQELYRAVCVHGLPNPLKSKVPLNKRRNTMTTSRDTIEAENENLLAQIKELQAHLNQIKGEQRRRPRTSEQFHRTHSYEGECMNVLNNVLETRRSMAEQSLKSFGAK